MDLCTPGSSCPTPKPIPRSDEYLHIRLREACGRLGEAIAEASTSSEIGDHDAVSKRLMEDIGYLTLALLQLIGEPEDNTHPDPV